MSTHDGSGASIRETAIAGCGVVSAAGVGIESLSAALRENRPVLHPSPRFRGSRFAELPVGDALGSAHLEEVHDPAWTLATLAADQSLEAAGRTLSAVPPSRRGLLLATTKANVDALERLSVGESVSDVARRHLRADLMAADLAAVHEIAGPVQALSVACASGVSVLSQGARWIALDQADAVLIVGVDHLSEFVLAGFCALRAVDPAGCRPFDRTRAGLSLGEAGAAVLLARSDLAAAGAVRVHGWGGSNDAHHMTGPSRDGAGLERAIRAALHSADLAAGDIDYVSAHGTGTRFNDAMESAALARVFGGECPPVSGIKGLLGHTLGAAGVVEAIGCVLAMREGFLPGTAGLGEPDADTPRGLLKMPLEGCRPQHVLKVSAGFGGINAAVVLSTEKSTIRRRAAEESPVVTVSRLAASESASAGRLDRSGRMDLPSRLAVAAVDELGLETHAVSPERVAICLAANLGSLATDIEYWTGRGEVGGPSPTLFAYTLPSAACGEISIRHDVRGPSLCWVGDDVDLLGEANALLRGGEADLCICVEVRAVTPEAAKLLALEEEGWAQAFAVGHEGCSSSPIRENDLRCASD